jgi:folate-dependent tRNA-U54 methylase TrmFO/GidA
MNANFGILPELEIRIKDKIERYTKLAEKSLDNIKNNG